MTRCNLMLAMALAACLGTGLPAPATADDTGKNLGKIGHIVVIYGENRSFDNKFGFFPGAAGLRDLPESAATQVDRDGTTLPRLPAIWGGVIDSHMIGLKPPAPQVTQIPQSATTDLPNRPFAINDPDGFNLSAGVATRDLVHRFYEHQMQINGGKNDMFAAWSDAGGLVMGHYAYPSQQAQDAASPLNYLARNFVLADHFFQAAFGGSYLNHHFLICACTPTLTPDQQTRKKVNGTGTVVVPISAVGPDGVSLITAPKSPASALDGPPVFVGTKALTPFDSEAGVYYTINTMQPPYPPSLNAVDLPQTKVDLDSPSTVPPSNLTTIGDLLSAAGVTWAWYAGAMNEAIAKGVYNGPDGIDPRGNQVPDFQPHHNPFNYYAAYAPGTAARAEHLRDGGMDGAAFIADIDANKLPAVAFYKPQGNLNEHPGYTDSTSGDRATYDIVVNHLMKSPAWEDMVVIITYDEFGGFWDHVAPPKGDRFGPATRIPTLIVSPFARKGLVDHTQYDTTSILRLITHRYNLPVLPGLTRRDDALIANGNPPMGDLTNALDLD